MSAAGPLQGANSSPLGGSKRSERGGAMSAEGPLQGANGSPLGAANEVSVGVP